MPGRPRRRGRAMNPDRSCANEGTDCHLYESQRCGAQIAPNPGTRDESLFILPRALEPRRTAGRVANKGEGLLTDGDGQQHAAAEDAAGPNGLVQESEELRALIAQGQERGYLTFEQIAGTLEEVEVTKEQVQGLHAHLIEQGVDVIGEDGLTAYKEAKGEGGREDQPKKAELDLTVEPSLD